MKTQLTGVYSHSLLGVEQPRPRWQRCSRWVQATRLSFSAKIFVLVTQRRH